VRKATIGGVTIDELLAAAAEFSIGLAFVLIGFSPLNVLLMYSGTSC
jgi:hypothetical protein